MSTDGAEAVAAKQKARSTKPAVTTPPAEGRSHAHILAADLFAAYMAAHPTRRPMMPWDIERSVKLTQEAIRSNPFTAWVFEQAHNRIMLERTGE